MPDLDTVALELYDTILSPEQLPRALHKVAKCFGAVSATLVEIDETIPTNRKIYSTAHSIYLPCERVDEYFRLHWQDELADHDQFISLLQNDYRIQIIDDSVLAKNEAELLSRPNLNFFLKYGLKHRAAALLNKDNLNMDRIGFQFLANRGPLTIDERKVAQKILPHLSKALFLARPLQEARKLKDSLLAALNALTVGICILDKHKCRVFENNAFIDMCEKHGFIKWNKEFRPIFHSRELGDKINQMMSDISKHGNYEGRPRKEAIILEDNGINIELCPIQYGGEIDSSMNEGTILAIFDSTQKYQFDLNSFDGLFGLTPTEIDILGPVLEGHTNKEIADIKDKSAETVKSQVKGILSKTDSENRTQLVRLAASLTSNILIKPD